MSLFRAEALESQKARFYGEVLIVRPLSITLLTILSCVLTGILICYLIFGQYTQRQRVSGILVPDKGLIKVYPQQPGTVLSIHVREGEEVEQGQLLYTLNSERITSDGRSAELAIRDSLLDQQRSLVDEGERQRAINQELMVSAGHRLEGLEQELSQIGEALTLLDRHIGLSKDNVSQYETLAQSGLLPKLNVDDKRAELLRLQASRLSLMREKTGLQRQIELAREVLATAEPTGKNQLAQIERTQKGIQQSLLELDSQRETRVTAPFAGTVTAILVRPGQMVGGTPLLSIVPRGSVLEAELYSPSNAISFVKRGSSVSLRFRAFPYEKFGQQRAVVSDISRAAVAIDELRPGSASSAASGVHVYRIVASLPKQTIRAYGNEEPLQPGMELEADILLDTRRLYEWLLAPLYSIAGKS